MLVNVTSEWILCTEFHHIHQYLAPSSEDDTYHLPLSILVCKILLLALSSQEVQHCGIPMWSILGGALGILIHPKQQHHKIPPSPAHVPLGSRTWSPPCGLLLPSTDIRDLFRVPPYRLDWKTFSSYTVCICPIWMQGALRYHGHPSSLSTRNIPEEVFLLDCNWLLSMGKAESYFKCKWGQFSI